MREAKAQTRLRTCAVSSESTLLADAISTRIVSAGIFEYRYVSISLFDIRGAASRGILLIDRTHCRP